MWKLPSNGIFLLFSTIITYYIGLKLPESLYKKTYLFIGLILNLGLLFFFKVYEPLLPILKNNFHTYNFNSLALPLGLSFYTFQAVSYIVDVHKKTIAAESNFLDFAVYHAFFPQLMAGPIERARNLLPQLKVRPVFNYENFRRGALFFALGLVKKLIIADRSGMIGESIISKWEQIPGYAIVFSGYAIVFQYYCDFSAYSEMALGIAQMMGIKLTTNFKTPFLATSPIDFWRRWHISLMQWLDDYVFSPILNLNFSISGTLIATMTVFILVGAWHGISLHYIIWGLINGFFVSINMIFRTFFKGKKNKIFNPIKTIATFHMFVLSGLFLAFDDTKIALKVFQKGITFKNFELGDALKFAPSYDLKIVFFAIPILITGEIIFSKIDFWKYYEKAPTFMRWLFYSLVILVLISFSYSKPRPYVYFKF